MVKHRQFVGHAPEVGLREKQEKSLLCNEYWSSLES